MYFVFQTLFYTTGEPKFVTVFPIYHKLYVVIVVHRLDQRQGLATKAKVFKFVVQALSPYAVVGLGC